MAKKKKKEPEKTMSLDEMKDIRKKEKSQRMDIQKSFDNIQVNKTSDDLMFEKMFSI